ncbi:ABC transporter substrate-binding protein [Leucobacter sp. UT-8R-CII-1-4]|uniref:ABC transporter substrate-binding protein n=1 Tax=Leucobacter sp. UT-8R-CII-1-4 TaxID=3040075 RepID=UPI0024A97C77|nr:ABC transporter substrate-binding protein [Leucobacter sp. UT-8R-CII-1-4]MDI6022807.1 ABC transporter substrate-binding protein [Leucobacter sp. UT-8R-CII-1-4]
MKKQTIAAFLAIGALALSGCSAGGGSGGGSGEPVIDGTLNYAINEDPGNLFQPLNSSATLSYVFPWAYEAPVYYDKEGKVHGWLATSWEETPTSVKFEIREDAVCSDGTPLTAETVANNYRWIIDPANGSALAGLIIPTDASVENEGNTVTLTTGTPNSFLLPVLGVNPIYCQGALDNPDSVKIGTNGSGMYKLTEAAPGDHYTFERRDDYTWAAEGAPTADTPGVPKQVVIRVIPNNSTRANLLLAGDLNIAAIPGADGERVASSLEPIVSTNLLSGGFVYSQAPGAPTEDENVRVALTKALDLDALMAVNTEGKGERATRIAVVSPEICQYDAATPNLPSHDVEAAEKMLDEAGWVKNSKGIREKNGKPLEIDFAWQTRWAENAATAEMIGEQWSAIGVKVNQHGSDYSAFSEKIFAGGAAKEFEAMWLAPNHIVPNTLAAFVSGPAPVQGNNFGELKNTEFDRLVAEASGFSGAAACPSWEQAEAAMYSAADYVPFAMRPDVAYGNGVKALVPVVGLDMFVTGVILVD